MHYILECESNSIIDFDDAFEYTEEESARDKFFELVHDFLLENLGYEKSDIIIKCFQKSQKYEYLQRLIDKNILSDEIKCNNDPIREINEYNTILTEDTFEYNNYDGYVYSLELTQVKPSSKVFVMHYPEKVK